ncbi:MAG: hypothetical protein H6565_15695 [Lewinellaceae bacterium]|nr:hypothetical protein [Lewinellaceae bacterium]
MESDPQFFHMYYRDQLAPDGRLNDVGAYIRTNLPGSYRSGLEMETSLALGSRMGLSGNLSLSRNRVTEFTEYRDNWDTGEQEKIVHRNTDLAFHRPCWRGGSFLHPCKQARRSGPDGCIVREIRRPAVPGQHLQRLNGAAGLFFLGSAPQLQPERSGR